VPVGLLDDSAPATPRPFEPPARLDLDRRLGRPGCHGAAPFDTSCVSALIGSGPPARLVGGLVLRVVRVQIAALVGGDVVEALARTWGRGSQ
jgi:hypothetical protein